MLPLANLGIFISDNSTHETVLFCHFDSFSLRHNFINNGMVAKNARLLHIILYRLGKMEIKP